MSVDVKVKAKEVVIEIDNELEKIEIGERENYTLEKFQKLIIEKSEKKNESLTTVRDAVKGEYRHMGYLEYLSMAWNNHYGIVMSPDIFWQLFLTQAASHIKDNSEKYRSLFTDSDEKKDIIVFTNDPQLINLNLIAEQLEKLTPTDTTMFLPEFSTTTSSSALAFRAAFADAMSPYYNYMMLMCGIPKVKLTGTEEDWDSISERIVKFKDALDGDEMQNYTERVAGLVTEIKDNYSNPNPEFWKEMFSLERCGSGSAVEVSGWIKDLYIKAPRPGYIGNYSSAVSYVSYKFLDTNQDFELCHGLFSSDEEDGYLVPDFGFIINEEK